MTTNQKKSIPVRELCLEVIIEVLEKGGYSHKLINATLTKYQYLEKQDRAFFTRLCEGTIEHAIELDYIINQFSKVKTNKQKPVIRNILRMAVYQMKYMDSVPASAACNEAVKLATKKGFHTLKGFVNGVLRNISRGMDEITYPDEKKEPVLYLHVRYSVPVWIIKNWLSSYDYETVKKILAHYQEAMPTSVRVNTNKIAPAELKNILEQEGITVEDGAYLDYAFRLRGYNYLNKIPAFNEGLFTVQDESSMLVGQVSGVKHGDYVIDVCSAPGGKTLHVANLLEGTGHVDSRDVSFEKIALIEENVERVGMKNVEVSVQDALVLDETSIGKADLLLADLPCSGLGVIGKKPDIKYKMQESQLQELAALQREILEVVTQYVKAGGTMIYSTCTINKEENEKNVQFIVDHLGFELESLDEYLPVSLQGETTKKGYLQLLPGTHQTDGFFLARLRKCTQ